VEVLSIPRLSKELVATGKQYRNRITITDANAKNMLLDNFEVNATKTAIILLLT
jgi:hypothetical protein